MFTIGLTGGIGSGKSTAAEMFAELGITVIDTDVLAREVVQPQSLAFKKIIAHFGASLLTNNGQLDRQQLSKRIFQNPAEKNWLEALLHPLILAQVEQEQRDATSPYCIVVIPLLIETLGSTKIDRILVIDAPESLQIKRTQDRDPQRPIEEIQAILKSQVSRAERLQAADDVIINDGSLEKLQEQVHNLHQAYLIYCANQN